MSQPDTSPAAQTPAAQTPAAQTPAAQTPAAQTPAAQTPAAQSADVTRRVLLRGVTVGGVALPLLAACGGGSTSSGSSGSAAAGGTVPAADVPVGGGTVLKDEKVVVTQPTKGDFKAFTAVCTHQGCTVGKVEAGEIVCPCHGSHFSIKDGSPVSGPAKAALASKTVTVKGDQISVS